MGILQFASVSDHITVSVTHYTNCHDDIHLHDDSNEFRAIREDWTHLQTEGLFLHYRRKLQVSILLSSVNSSQFIFGKKGRNGEKKKGGKGRKKGRG